MSVSQTAFRMALLDPGAAVPAGLCDPEARPAVGRFAVYRNNVSVNLTEALETAFPVLRKIVGDAFFRAMAGVFLRLHPPQTPVLSDYGAKMPEFLERFPPVAHLGYLADVARLELAIRAAYHAADADPVGADAFAGGDLTGARLTLAPAVRVLRSRWPLHGIWRVNMGGGETDPGRGPQDVLITRPGFDPVLSPLPPGGAAFIEALGRGAPLAAAALSAGEGFDPGPTLGMLLQGQAIATVRFGGAR